MSVAAGPATGQGERKILRPSTWPVRWRLAAASAGLTLAILLIFAAVIGRLASERIRSDFNGELHGAVRALAAETQVVDTLEGPLVKGLVIDDFALPNDATVRIFDARGQLLDATPNAADLGPPRTGTVEVNSMRVVTAPVISPSGQVAGYVQYGRSDEHIDSTIAQLWLFILAGVLGGTLLASFAGLAIADRAMRPIASLTATAREIAATRDPSRQMPPPTAGDEVGELAQTLETMLRSLDASRAEREAAMQKQREFVADASHELRTPLTSVLANLELLEASLAERTDEREMVDSALRSSRRMKRLVADLLLLARADAGRISERAGCDLSEIADAALSEVAPVSGARRLELSNGTPVPVRGNPDELHRMVLNLLDNAVSHTPDHARIAVRVEAADGIATLEVADDGPGIPEANREQVFDRFVRGTGPADTAGGSGTGLGLAIVRAVARSHGGEVEASRSPLGGALFRVTLPLATSEESVTARLRTL
jgi:two-component system, OmpR family, sensor kinase